MRGFCVHFFNRKLLPSSNCVLRPHLLLGYQIQTEAHRSHNSFSCHMIQLSLYTILGTKGGQPASPCHQRFSIVGSVRWIAWIIPFSDFFAKKPLNFKEINSQFGLLSQSILRKSSQFFTESTCSPTSKVYRNLQRRP